MVRPRLTDLEIQFLVESLKHTLTFVDHMEGEYKGLQHKVYRLKKELHYNTMVWRELKAAKEELSNMGNFESMAFHYRLVCRSLIRRLEGLLRGRKLHTSFFAEHSLRQIYLEPKTLEKSQSLWGN